MKWTEHFRINSHDTDASGQVRASLMLRYMQETANLQLKTLGPTVDELLAMGAAFFLSRINLSLYRPLHAYDEIDVSSWACESRGVSFNRCYEIRKNGELVAEAASVWGLVGIDDRRLFRVDEIQLGFDVADPLELDAPKRVRIPRDLSLALVGERPIAYSDIDQNGHMNNTNYPDMLCDFIPGMEKKHVLSFAISFAGEARLGETLKIYTAKSDGQTYFRTTTSGGAVNVEAIIMTEEN